MEYRSLNMMAHMITQFRLLLRYPLISLIIMTVPLSKIAQAFASKGYSRGSVLDQQQFFSLLNSLSQSKYDTEIASELWQQVQLNSRQQASVQQLCAVIAQAQGILVDKVAQAKERINELENRKNTVEKDTNLENRMRVREIEQMEEEIREIKEELGEVQSDLRMVTLPFGVPVPNTDTTHGRRVRTHLAEYDDNELREHYTPPAYSDQLRWILYLTTVLLFMELLIINVKYNFLNLLVLTTILSIFFLNYFDPIYIRICCGLTLISIIVDLVWMLVESGYYWNTPGVGVHSKQEVGLLRLVVFFGILIMFSKIPLLLLLFKFWNVKPNTRYTVVAVCEYKIHLTSKNPRQSNNLISRSIFNQNV